MPNRRAGTGSHYEFGLFLEKNGNSNLARMIVGSIATASAILALRVPAPDVNLVNVPGRQQLCYG